VLVAKFSAGVGVEMAMTGVSVGAGVLVGGGEVAVGAVVGDGPGVLVVVSGKEMAGTRVGRDAADSADWSPLFWSKMQLLSNMRCRESKKVFRKCIGAVYQKR
jgi:hypothetical protein